MARFNIVQAINQGLRQEMERNPSVVVLGEDVGRDGGVFRVTEGLLERFGEDRVIDTPLSESGLIGMSIGMAAYGLVPVAEIQFMGFLYAAMEQLISHASRIRTRSRGQYHCPMVLRTPYGAGIHAPEHHSESTEAMLVHTPGLKVVVPASPSEAKGLLISAIRDPDPVIFLEPAKIYRAIKEDVPEGEYALPLGKARTVREGDDLTLIAWGAMLYPTLAAADDAAAGGIAAEVLDLRTLSPMDSEAILASVRKTGRVVVVHEAPRTGGLGGEIAALIAERALEYLNAPIARVTGFDTPVPLPKTENYYLPNKERVLQAMHHVMEF
ncbi:MAG TPA: alpha-ketoacid dehydrogenase subunit beta [Nitrospiria bacterium]|nr:alpha-ketoacid dehydrogenase subunit beta [Nitrospiria bacterium]